MKNIESYEKELKEYANDQLQKLTNIEYYSKQFHHNIIAFNIKGSHPQDIATYLGNNGLIVRSGLSCAKLSKCVTNVNAVVRVSLYFYNTKKDIDKLVKLLKNYHKGDELKYVIQ